MCLNVKIIKVFIIYILVICGKVNFIIDILLLFIDDIKKYDNKEFFVGMICLTNELINYVLDFVFKFVF